MDKWAREVKAALDNPALPQNVDSQDPSKKLAALRKKVNVSKTRACRREHESLT